MLLSPHSSRFDHPCSIWGQCSSLSSSLCTSPPLPCKLVRLRPKYSPQQPVLKHTRPTFPPSIWETKLRTHTYPYGQINTLVTFLHYHVVLMYYVLRLLFRTCKFLVDCDKILYLRSAFQDAGRSSLSVSFVIQRYCRQREVKVCYINPFSLNEPYSGRTAPLTSKRYTFIQQI